MEIAPARKYLDCHAPIAYKCTVARDGQSGQRGQIAQEGKAGASADLAVQGGFSQREGFWFAVKSWGFAASTVLCGGAAFGVLVWGNPDKTTGHLIAGVLLTFVAGVTCGLWIMNGRLLDATKALEKKEVELERVVEKRDERERELMKGRISSAQSIMPGESKKGKSDRKKKRAKGKKKRN